MRWLLASALVVAILSQRSACAMQDGDAEIYRLPPVEAETLPAESLRIEESESPAPPRTRSSAPGMADRSPLKLHAYWMPATNTTQSSDLSLAGSGVNLAVPLSISERGIWLATLGFQHLHIGGDVVLPDSMLPLPSEFWRIQVGATHIRQFENGWSAGAMVSVGSASDQPFAGFDEMTATVLGFCNVPSGERDAWNFSIFYSPASQLPFPIPGITYDWHPNEQLSIKIGVPFSLEYRATETTTLTASYMPLTNVRAFVRQRVGENWQVYGGYEVVNDTYFLADRLDAEDRLYFFDQRARVGIERKLPLGLNADFSTAYVFDREIFQSTSFSGDRHDVIGLDPGVSLLLSISWQR